MPETMTDFQAERLALERAAEGNGADASAQLKAAQFEARVWLQNAEEGDLARIAHYLDRALAHLPAEKRPSVVQFVQQLHQRGAELGPILQTGRYPLLLALLTNRPLPTDAPPVERPTPPPMPMPETDSTPPPSAQGVAAPRRTAARKGARTMVRTIDVGDVTNDKIKAWIAGGKIEEIANAYPLIENFRTRRVVIEKVAESPTPLAAACLLKMLAHTHDENLVAEIVKRLQGFDPKILANELTYDPNDPKTKLAVVTAMAAIQSDESVEPLTRAMKDPDPHVRSKAVHGLAEMFEPSTEWIGQLIMIVRRDPDSSVKMAAARALAALETPEALDALDAAAKEPGFDENLKIVLESMRAKVSGGALAARKAKMTADQQTDQKKKFSIGIHLGGKEMAVIGILLGAVFVVGIIIKVAFDKFSKPPGGVVIGPRDDWKPLTAGEKLYNEWSFASRTKLYQGATELPPPPKGYEVPKGKEEEAADLMATPPRIPKKRRREG